MYPHVIHLETRWRGLERDRQSNRKDLVEAARPSGPPSEWPWRLLPSGLDPDEPTPPEAA